MTELDCRERALAANEIGNPAVSANMIVRIDPGAFIGFAATLLHRCFFGENDARAAYRVFPEVHEMPVCRAAAHRLVLAHRRNNDAIAGKNPPEGNRLKEKRKPDAPRMDRRQLRKKRAPHYGAISCADPITTNVSGLSPATSG